MHSLFPCLSFSYLFSPFLPLPLRPPCRAPPHATLVLAEGEGVGVREPEPVPEAVGELPPLPLGVRVALALPDGGAAPEAKGEAPAFTVGVVEAVELAVREELVRPALDVRMVMPEGVRVTVPESMPLVLALGAAAGVPAALKDAPPEALSRAPPWDCAGESAKPDKTAPIPKLGISLEGILAFVERCGSDFTKGLSTTPLDKCSTDAAKTNFVLRHTSDLRGSYCDVLLAEGSPHVGPATHFVSHSWRYRFLDVVDTLAHFAEAQGGSRTPRRGGVSMSGETDHLPPPTVYFWFDVRGAYFGMQSLPHPGLHTSPSPLPTYTDRSSPTLSTTCQPRSSPGGRKCSRKMYWILATRS